MLDKWGEMKVSKAGVGEKGQNLVSFFPSNRQISKKCGEL